MTAQHISDILAKLTELRELFVLGQRALPFLEEVFSFLEEISPLLDEINASMQDTSAKMPKATSQLQSVSQATELATNEILDLIDAVLLKSGQEKERLKQAATRVEALAEADAGLLALLRETELPANLLAEIEVFFAQKHEAYANISGELLAEVRSIDEIRDKINRIMMSLQVQDITTQQIAAVNHLIESIRRRMELLVQRLGETNYQEMVDSLPHPGTFDANARYDWSGTRQAAADGVMRSIKNGDALPQEATISSQDDIDALFGAPPAPSAPSAPASQDDIDALFGAPPAPPSAPASQDDIDALFGN